MTDNSLALSHESMVREDEAEEGEQLFLHDEPEPATSFLLSPASFLSLQLHSTTAGARSLLLLVPDSEQRMAWTMMS